MLISSSSGTLPRQASRRRCDALASRLEAEQKVVADTVEALRVQREEHATLRLVQEEERRSSIRV